MAAAVRGTFIYSGGISSLDDLRALAELRQVNLTGVIVGKALYEERFDVAAAPGRAGRLMHYKRVIPCLDVDGGRVVKGVGFVDLRDAGRPGRAGRAATTPPGPTSSCSWTSPPPRTSARRSSTSRVGRPTRCSSRSRSAAGSARWPTPRRCSTPAPTRCRSTRPRWRGPDLIDELAATFGQPSAWCWRSTPSGGTRRGSVAGRTLRWRAGRSGGGPDAPGSWEAYLAGGRTPTGRDAVAWAREGVQRGAGEILLTSMDRDGTNAGYDLELTATVAAGGAGAGDRLRRGRCAGRT